MDDNTFYAHSLGDMSCTEQWQTLEDHLHNVAEIASHFTDAFGSAQWGRLAGLWHDIGKYREEFQRKLLGEHNSAEHSGAGAALSLKKNGLHGHALAFIIAGHHSGMANPNENINGGPKPLSERIRSNESVLQNVIKKLPPEIHNIEFPALPEFLSKTVHKNTSESDQLNRNWEFWTRFLFSALVDADRLDTESFCSPEKAVLRCGYDSIDELRDKIDGYIDGKIEEIPEVTRNTPVNRARATVLDACRAAAEEPQGFFSLTVPTGGGKTLFSMSFALRHAVHNSLQRVIVVIPYTSIIEQNAAIYATALGRNNVIEHHSNFDPKTLSDDGTEETPLPYELACENWDAPVIVTTTVQFFESLFSNRPSTCRKLHNIAKSVIILDEVQTLPTGYLNCILDALNELVAHYGCSIVLSTATPPSLAKRESFPSGIENVRPIIRNRQTLANQLRRVEYVWPSPGSTPTEWPDIARQIASHQKVLSIVHKRNDARTLAGEIKALAPDEPLFHLSALMCPAHRSDILGKIKESLVNCPSCRVVSTQLVEAGVDIDFPVVFRALGGLDSIVQAAGRCNREGRAAIGNTIVFHAPTSPPPGTPCKALDVMKSLLIEKGGSIDPDDPALFDQYFRTLYSVENKDTHAIQSLRSVFNFASVDREFEIIKDNFTASVVAPYGDAPLRIEALRKYGPSKQTFRALQQFTVSVHLKNFEKLLSAGAIEEIYGVYAITHGFEGNYDPVFGLVAGDDISSDPAAFII